jgi:two-component system NarL family sensor kinase
MADIAKLSAADRRELELDGICSFATVPLVSKGNVLGALDFASQTLHQFTNDEELLLQTFGRQIAIAVENTKLFDDARRREQQVRSLSIDLARLQEDERKNFARELHDGLSQVLTTLKIMTELALKNFRNDVEGTEQHLREVITLAEEAQAEAKQIAHGLRPAVLDDFGLKAAIPMLASRFERRTGIVVELHLPSDDIRFDTLVETNVYRIVQELLANVAKHSNANRVVVQLLERDGTLALNISDNGIGLPKETLRKGDAHHSGLRNLRERVEFLGGTFRAESTVGSGTEFLIEMPAAVAVQQSEKVDQPT